MRRVLMVAYHFPPFAGSSGVQRALRFASHLPEFGWEPVVLTAHRRAYEQLSEDLLDQIPPEVRVIRAPAWDTKRHLTIAGRFPRFLARPDRWKWWWWGAVPAGLAAIRRYQPSAIWSTYPIATAHSIGATLAALSRLPWIADFRDPMAQDDYPKDPATWRSFARVERAAVTRATRSTFTTPSALELYRHRYPAQAAGLRLLENGYDEGSFAGHGVAADEAGGAALNPGRVTLLHSGMVYPEERDPTALFQALGNLRQSAPETFAKIIVRFRAPSHDALIHRLTEQYDVASAVEVLPPVRYAEAIGELCRADGLLILQASNCNAQIPAKLYEYVRANRPVLLLTDPAGDTAAAARRAGITSLARLDDAASIASLLQAFVSGERHGMLPDPGQIEQASRRARTRQLAGLLDEVASPAVVAMESRKE